MKHFYSFLFFYFVVSLSFLQAQEGTSARVGGVVTDALSNRPVELVTIYIEGTNTAVETDEQGRYTIVVPTNESFTLVFSRLGYKETSTTIGAMPARSRRNVDVALAPADSDVEVIVRESRIQDGGMVREDMTQLKLLPTTTGNLESVLPHIALGTSSGTGGELSSQYNVRGGNYDENLVYVNDFEIYRPQLIRAGQQEGLTFPNIDLVRDLSFSSGGFEAKYGDKLSSVLDIKYKRPDSLRSSISMSFLGASAHIEGSMDVGSDNYRKFRYLLGARYKTNEYLLGTLDTRGEYNPNFADVQTYLTYDLNKDWQLGFLANYNRSEYSFIPNERNTAFGSFNDAFQLFTLFEGQEIDDFTTMMGGLSLTYLPDRDHNPYYLKFLGSGFRSEENIRFDIIGDYSLRQVETNLGSDNFGDVIAELGTGTQQDFVRDFLILNVYNAEHKGGMEFQLSPEDPEVTSSHFLQWSVKYQREEIDDLINSWERFDSAGYSWPYDTNQVQLLSVIKSRNNLSSNRMSAYVQNTFTYRKEARSEIKLSLGVRATYWDLNEELNISPRVQLLYKPLSAKSDISYRLAAGLYYQPPFYRELRRPDGTLNTGLQAQKSAHIVGGITWDFFMGKQEPKKFRFIMEAYYKQLWDLVSYDIDNVRIRYYGENDATGYAAGVDIRLNGEFVPGAESWINLSFLRVREKLEGVQHLEPGRIPTDDVPRPSDQLMTLSMFFQDYLPKNENFKTHLNLTVGTGLPYGFPFPNNREFRNTFRFPAYHRIDIGFSLALWDQTRRARRPKHPLRFSRNTWLSLEVYNLMNVQNQASITWIRTILEQSYAVPNFLTSRRINLRLRMDF